MDKDVAYAKWEELHEDWLFANQAARLHRHEIQKRWESGAQPEPSMLERALELERVADYKMHAVAGHIKEAFH